MSPHRIAVRLLFWGGGVLLTALLWPPVSCFPDRLCRRSRHGAAGGAAGPMAHAASPGLRPGGDWRNAAAGAGSVDGCLPPDLRNRTASAPAPLASDPVPGGMAFQAALCLPGGCASTLREALTSAADRLIAEGLSFPSSSSGLTAGSRRPGGGAALFFTLTTGILSIFFCSADLPRIRSYLRELIPEEHRGWVSRFLSCLRRAALDWCRVQGRLMVIVFLLLTAGLLLLRVPYAFLAAILGR